MGPIFLWDPRHQAQAWPGELGLGTGRSVVETCGGKKNKQMGIIWENMRETWGDISKAIYIYFLHWYSPVLENNRCGVTLCRFLLPESLRIWG